MNREERRTSARQQSRAKRRPQGARGSNGHGDLAVATQHHQAGRLAQAEEIYRRILQWQPNHADALHLLGLSLFQAGQHDQAVLAMTKAIKINSDAPTFHNDLALALRAQGYLDKAADHLQRALVLDPHYPEAYQNLGVVLTERGEPAAAIESLQHALELKPENPEALNSLGVALWSHGKLEEGLESFNRALELRPDFPEAHHNLGVLLRDRGEMAEAIERFQRATTLKPDYGEAYNNLGLALMLQGEPEEAAVSLQQAARLLPGSPGVLVNLGAALRNQGRHDEAVERFRQALELNADFVEAHINLGACLRDQGKSSEAAVNLRRAVDLNPQSVEALTNLGVVLGDLGNRDEAVASLRQALELKPDFVDAHTNLGSVLRSGGLLEEACDSFRRAIELKPDFAEAHNNLAVVLRERGALAEAIDSFRRAAELNPDYVEAQGNLGLALADSGDHEGALVSLQRVLEAKPDYAEAYNNIGLVYKGLHRLDEGIENVRRALELRPDYPEAYSNLGVLLGEQKKHDEAIENLQHAVDLKPDYVEAHNNLGVALRNQERLEEAQVSMRRALELKPDYPEAHHNLAIMRVDLDDPEEAESLLSRAVELKPDYADAQFALAMTQLLQGNLAQGFEKYEWRWRGTELAGAQPEFPQPRWDGRPLDGRTILLHVEQGIGDMLQFTRYAPLVAARGGRVVLMCQSEIAPLMRRLDGIDQVVERGEPLPAFDVYAPLLSVPHLLGTTLETIPSETPYLKADPIRVAAWAEYLNAQSPEGLRVGLVWAGNPDHKADHRRSIKLDMLAPLAQVPGVHFFALQKGPAAAQGDRPPAGMALTNLGPLLGDFDDTAAILEQLDLVITVDTSVAHLAGALGRTVWLLLALAPDWRWLRKREDSPWYPTARLFRQERFGEWEDVVTHVSQALSKLTEDQSTVAVRPVPRLRPASAVGAPSPGSAIYVAMPLGRMYGWGICGRYLTKELALLGETRLVTNRFDLESVSDELEYRALEPLVYNGLTAPADSPVLQGITGHEMLPFRPTVRGRFSVGYTFFEANLLPPTAIENARRHFDLVVTGSTWCREVLEAYGLDGVRTVIQGIDPTIFFSSGSEKERFRDRFVVYSGGKFELRKGQDLVIRAFKVLQDRHPDVLLVNAWSNAWEYSFESMSGSPHIRFAPTATDQLERINQILADNDIDLNRVLTLPVTRNTEMPEIYRNTDVGLFPNRCEGGTNLVLMEYMACGRPVVATYTSGHRDIVNNDNAVLIRTMGQASIVMNERQIGVWDDPNLEETVEALEWAYQNRERLREIGNRAGQDLAQLTWRHTAEQFYEILSNGVRKPRSSNSLLAVLTKAAEEPPQLSPGTDSADEAPAAWEALLILLQQTTAYDAIRSRLVGDVPTDTWQEDGLHYFAFDLLSIDESGPSLPEPETAVFAIHAESMRLISAIVVTPDANGGEPEIMELRPALAESA
jgi:tetratricopeptide (TPR) repeat protein/glycosyltransferase involved in cell wall biosynthesis